MIDYIFGGIFWFEVGLGECEFLNVNLWLVVEFKNIIKFSMVKFWIRKVNRWFGKCRYIFRM